MVRYRTRDEQEADLRGILDGLLWKHGREVREAAEARFQALPLELRIKVRREHSRAISLARGERVRAEIQAERDAADREKRRALAAKRRKATRVKAKKGGR